VVGQQPGTGGVFGGLLQQFAQNHNYDLRDLHVYSVYGFARL